MTIETTYRDLLLEEHIKEQLKSGELVSASEIAEQIEELIDTLDLSLPQFQASTYYVVTDEASSVSKHTETFSTIRNDLRALYKELINLVNTSALSFERWRLEISNLEKKLIDLESRIDELLLLAQDIEGYFGVLIDNFTDTSLIDLENSTIDYNLQGSLLQIGAGADSISRVFLNDLDLINDTSFKVKNTSYFLSRIDEVDSDLTNIFHQESKAWRTSIMMSKAIPVTCELTVKISQDDPVEITKIFIDLHSSNESGSINITPLYSTDNQNYQQLPTVLYTQDVYTQATFLFSVIEAKWIKFILTKPGADPSAGTNSYNYEFGFKEISFYQESFEEDTIQTFISHPMYVLKDDGSIQDFEKLTLETCEKLETDTYIDYYINVSNDWDEIETSFDPDDATWYPISPINRSSPLYPQILDIGDVSDILLGISETIQIAYNSTGNTDLVNPSDPFHLLSKNTTTGAVINDTVHVKNYLTTPVLRYTFQNTNDRILNYQIKDSDYTGSGTGDAVTINEDQIILFRNIGEKGLDAADTTSYVRSTLRGWKFEDPYYSCVIEIQNMYGISIDFGDSEVIIDDTKYTGVVNNTILTGRTSANYGIHTVKIHKNNWQDIPLTLPDGTTPPTTVAHMKQIDPLYPYNHKHLIEGYDYDSSFTETQIYTGVDIFAEMVMQQVSIFDLINNIKPDNYDVYALDRDTPNSHTEDNEATRVFVLKIDANNPDSFNERFAMRLVQINNRQKYIRLKADFKTLDEEVTSVLHSYRIRLG